MSAKKGEKRALGRGAVQTGKRPPAEYYQVAPARFRKEDVNGREFQAWLKEKGISYREIITVIVEFPYIQAAILRELGKE